jgi:hypothetical protein
VPLGSSFPGQADSFDGISVQFGEVEDLLAEDLPRVKAQDPIVRSPGCVGNRVTLGRGSISSRLVLDQRGQLLRAALGFAGLPRPSYDRSLRALRTWLDSWSGVGHVTVGWRAKAPTIQSENGNGEWQVR